MLLRTCLLLLIASIGAAHAATKTEAPLGRLPRTVVPESVALELRIDPHTDGYAGNIDIGVDITAETDTIWLHGRDLEIEEVILTPASGEAIPLRATVGHADAGVLKLAAPGVLSRGKAVLSLRYRAKFDENQLGAYKIKSGGESYIATHMEPLGARRAFPGFDEPSFKTPWNITLVVPPDQQAFTNSVQVAEVTLPDGWKRLRFATTEKLPSYLVAFAVGPWDVVEWEDIPPNAVRKMPLKLRGIAAKGRGKEMTYSLQHTAEVVDALETYFDHPYPFDKLDLLAIPDFVGGMENAGLIAYSETLLLGVDQAPTLGRQSYWSTHAHELAHQWFGNLITMPWWDDLWLNEAFATWIGNKIVHQLQPDFHEDRKALQASLWVMTWDSLASTRRVHESVHDYSNVASATNDVAYQKGGAMLTMFEAYLGEDAFRDGVREHMRSFARGNATSLDLMHSLSAHSRRPETLRAAFASFLDQPGVPFLRTELNCADRPTLTVRQQRYLPLGSKASDRQTWGVPMCVRYPDGESTRTQCELIDDARSEFALKTKRCPAWLHPNADGAGYYRFAVAKADQAALDGVFERLSEREQRVYADSLTAAFRNGALSIQGLLSAVPKLAASRARQVVIAPNGDLDWLREHIAKDAQQRVALERWIGAVYAPRMLALGFDAHPDDSDETRLLRQFVITLLVDIARDSELRTRLAQLGRKVLGLDGDGALYLDAIDSDKRGVALQLVGELGGETEFDAIEKHLRVSHDALLRRQLLIALGGFPQPQLSARARALILDPAVKSDETLTIMHSQTSEPAMREVTRRWFRQNFEDVFKKVPQMWRAYLPDIDGYQMCSEADAAALQQRYGQRMKEVEGGPLSLAQREEAVRLCAALRAHHAREGLGSLPKVVRTPVDEQ